MRRGLAATRQQAQDAVEAGRVLVAGARADKASRLVGTDQAVVIVGPPPRFVSRGGEKLDAALDRFGVDVTGRRAVDAGASTGGFTDCLLQRGVSHVYAVDVGHGQLDVRLRHDARVSVLERTNVRDLTVDRLGALTGEEPDPVHLVTADLSFISLATVASPLVGLVVDEGGDLVVLVKPQFEAGRADVSRGKGVVRDPALWRGALDRVLCALFDAGTGIMGVMASPLVGHSGNAEFLVHAVTGTGRRTATVPADQVDAAVADAIAATGGR